MAARPQKKPNGYAATSHPSPPRRPLPAVILVASTGIQSCHMCVRLPPLRPSRWRQGRKKNLTATPQFPVLSSSSRPARESSHSVGKTRTGFPPSARMTAGKGRAIPGVVRVFFLRPSFSVILVASTGIQSCPVSVFLPSVTMAAKPQKKPNGYAATSHPSPPRRPLPAVILVASTGIQSCHMCVRLPSPVTMAARPQKNLTATPQCPVLSSFSRLSFFVRHSRALPGNPVSNCEDQDWIPAFGENDGREGEGKGRGRTKRCGPPA